MSIIIPERLLLLDRDPAAPRWVVASVVMSTDIKPAEIDAIGRYVGWSGIARWASHQIGQPIELTPVFDSLAWTVSPRSTR